MFTFYCSDKDNNEVGVGIELGGVDDAMVHFVRSLGLLQHAQ